MERVADIACEALVICDFSTVGKKNYLSVFFLA